MYHHARTSLQIPFRYIEPTFYAGLLDDPVLLLRNRPAGSNLMIDCGQIHHLAKRVLKAVDRIFISHAHMDHFMGLSTFVRNILVSTKTVDVFGPEGLATRLHNLLGGFDWNLCEDFWCTIRVHEISRQSIARYDLPGPSGFLARPSGEIERPGETVFEDDHLSVRAAACDHRIESLVYRVDEKPGFGIDEKKMEQYGLVTGEWLRELNRRFHRGELDDGPITVKRRQGDATDEAVVTDAAALYRDIRASQTPISIGYLCDAGFSRANRNVFRNFFGNLTVLVCEATYLAADVERARISRHLCTTDLNCLMDELRPQFVVPIHVSKSYNEDTGRIFDELEAPEGCSVLRLPDHIAPRPYLPDEIPGPTFL